MNTCDEQRCCCNCKYQVSIRSHPSNIMVGGRLKGPLLNIVAFGCAALEDGTFVFSENKHSLCEMYSRKITQKELNG